MKSIHFTNYLLPIIYFVLHNNPFSLSKFYLMLLAIYFRFIVEKIKKTNYIEIIKRIF